jgi:hypothetical protein
MSAWIIKSETDDPDRALEIVADQRSKGYNAWIEDENGAAVDEQSLKTDGRVATKRTLSERLMGPLFVGASVVAGLFVLYLVGLWVDVG